MGHTVNKPKPSLQGCKAARPQGCMVARLQGTIARERNAAAFSAKHVSFTKATAIVRKSKTVLASVMWAKSEQLMHARSLPAILLITLLETIPRAFSHVRTHS